MQELTRMVKEKSCAVKNADHKTFVQIVNSAARFIAQNSTVLVVAQWNDVQPLLNSLHELKSCAVQRSRVLIDTVSAREMKEVDAALYELDSALQAQRRLRDIYQH